MDGIVVGRSPAPDYGQFTFPTQVLQVTVDGHQRDLHVLAELVDLDGSPLGDILISSDLLREANTVFNHEVGMINVCQRLAPSS